MSPTKSAAAIEDALIKIGAKRVGKEYRDGKLNGITFQLDTNGIPMIFKIDANVEGVEKTLRDGHAAVNRSFKEQAEITAWRLLLDEIEVKAARITIEKMNPLKAFLGDVYNIETEKTFFEALEAGKFKMLGAGK